MAFAVLGIVVLVVIGLLYASTRLLSGKGLAIEEMRSQAACRPGWRVTPLGICAPPRVNPPPTPQPTPVPTPIIIPPAGEQGGDVVPTPTPTPVPVPDRLPVSNVEAVTCDWMWGWVYDPDTKAQSVDVHVYDGTRFVSAFTTAVVRQDVNQAFGLTGAHGFYVPLPDVFKDGQSHLVRLYAINTLSGGGVNPEMTASPKNVQCAGSVSVDGVRFQVGESEMVVTDSARKAAGLAYWPDGHLGILNQANGQYDFLAANGGQVSSFRGSLENPLQQVVQSNVAIAGMKQNFDYVGGGPVYVDSTGVRVMVYHAENWLVSGGAQFYSRLGMAAQGTDGTWRDLGLIIAPEVGLNTHAEIGGGEYQIVGDYMYVYFHDTLVQSEALTVAVARISLFDLRNAVVAGKAPVFTKYYNGTWNQAGLGGKSSAVIPRDGNYYGWPSVVYDATARRYVMALFKYGQTAGEWDLYFSVSTDAVRWSAPQRIEAGSGRTIYPTIIGQGYDPQVTNGSFYVYYVYSTSIDQHVWANASLVRRLITIR